MAYIENGEAAVSIRNKMNEGLLTPATVNKSGSVLNITAPEGSKYIYFTTPSDYSPSDTYKINGVGYMLRSQNNLSPSNAWKSGVVVRMFLEGNIAYVYDVGDLDYLPLTGGTLTGNLRMGSDSYGGKINFGSGDNVYIYEKTDNGLEIKSTNLNFVCTSLMKNGEEIGGNSYIFSGQFFTNNDTNTISIGPIKFLPKFIIMFPNNCNKGNENISYSHMILRNTTPSVGSKYSYFTCAHDNNNGQQSSGFGSMGEIRQSDSMYYIDFNRNDFDGNILFSDIYRPTTYCCFGY